VISTRPSIAFRCYESETRLRHPISFFGGAQEKKGLKKQALKSYQRYLDLYPTPKMATKCARNRKLYKEVEKKRKSDPRPFQHRAAGPNMPARSNSRKRFSLLEIP